MTMKKNFYLMLFPQAWLMPEAFNKVCIYLDPAPIQQNWLVYPKLPTA